MNLSRIEPWSLANTLQRGLVPVRHLSVPLKSGFGASQSVAANAADWRPAVDIVEEESRFVLRADLPGVDPSDIEVNSDKGSLTLRGEKHSQKSETESGVQRLERSAGRFERRFTLPESADTDAISATSSNGTLEISIPKNKNESRRITIEAA